MLELSTFFLSHLSLTRGKAIFAFYWNLSSHVALLNINKTVYTGSLYKKKLHFKKIDVTLFYQFDLIYLYTEGLAVQLTKKITSQD